jgi:hypothetical protein
VTQYAIERISLANLHHVQTLYRAAFRKRVSLDFLRKKYSTKFTGAEVIGYLAFAPDRLPAAFYAVFPCFFRINGESVLAAQSGDTMTHPLHRRQGLFFRLALETYALAKENDILFVFGFPNKYSFPGLVKLGWKFHEAHMKLFKLKANPIAFAKITTRITLLKDVYRNALENKYPISSPERIFLHDSHDGVIKGKDFLDYKGYSNSYFIEIEQVPVWIKLNSTLKIGYVDLRKITSFENFLKKLKRIAFRSGCSHVVFLTTTNTPLHTILHYFAPAEESFPVGFYKLTDRQLNFSNVQFDYCDIDIF